MAMKPGQTAPKSGQIEMVGSRGGRTGVERTISKGETIPPTSGKGMSYVYSDLTKNGSGTGKTRR